MMMQDNSAPESGGGPRDRTKPAEEVRSRWEWTEASVWTNRMLTTLEQGVKGGKWFSLMDNSWLRMRLRKGRGRGWDHHRWKNSYFARNGLFDLTAAPALACQSSLR